MNHPRPELETFMNFSTRKRHELEERFHCIIVVKSFEYETTRMTVLGRFAALGATLGHGMSLIRIENSPTILRKANFLLLFRVPVPGHHFGKIRAIA